MTLVLAVGFGLLLMAGTLLFSRLSVSQLAFATVAVLVTIISWNGIRFGGGSFANGFFVVATLLTLLYVVVDRVPVIFPPWLLACAALLFLAFLTTAVFPPDPALIRQSDLQFVQIYAALGAQVTTVLGTRSDVSALMNWEIALLVLPFIVGTVARTQARLTRLLDLWTLGAAANALVGILDLGGLHTLAAVPILGHRSAGLTIHPNYLALTCLFGLPTAARMIGTSRRRNLLGVSALLILLGGEYASGSRDGAVSAVVLVLLSMVVLPRMRFLLRYVIPIAALVLGVGLAVPSVGHQLLVQTRLAGGGTNLTSVNGSDYQRHVFAQVARSEFAARPLSGIGMFADNDAQSIYLQILAAGGVVAMAGIVVLVGGMLASIRRLMRTQVGSDALAVGIAIIGWLLNGVFDAQLADKYIYVLPGLLIGCAQVARGTRMTMQAEAGGVLSGTVRSHRPATSPATPSPAYSEPVGAR